MALTYENVVDDSILLHFETQKSFSDFVEQQTGGGAENAKVDLAKQQITYVPKFHKREELVVRAHLLASIATEPHSVMWAWANEHFAGQSISRLSERIRGFGENNGIAELTTGERELGGVDPEQAARQIAAIGCRITGMPAAHIASAGGTVVVFAIDPAGFALGQPDAHSFPEVVLGPIHQGGWVHDTRRAVQGYAQARNIPHGWAEGFTGIQLTFPQGPVTIDFSPEGSIADVRADLA